MTLPAGPGDTTSETFSPQLRNRLRYDFGLVLHALCARGAAFERFTLSMGARLVLVTIASYWHANDEAWPSQDRIATSCACSVRSVRRYVDTLERAGLLRLRRTHQPNGRERIFYSPGFVLLRELALVEERYPRTRAKGLRRCSVDVDDALVPSETPDTVAVVTPDTVAEELTDQDLEPSSCESAATTASDEQADDHETEEEESISDPSADTEQIESADQISAGTPQISLKHLAATLVRSVDSDLPPTEIAPTITDDDRALAREILGERMARKFPDRALPRWFDRGEVEQVARCTLLLEGDRDAKIAAHRGALDAAFAASKSGPPTVKFIWGSIEHFLGHVDRGLAIAKKRAAQSAKSVAAPPSSTPPATPPSAEERAKMREDIARLFGAIARPSFVRGVDEAAP
jgi:hypothetical protein